MSTTHSIAHLDTGHTYDVTARLQASIGGASVALSAPTLCDRRGCGSFDDACWLCADKPSGYAPRKCRICGGFYVALPVGAGEQALITIADGRAYQFVFGYPQFKPNPACRVAGVATRDGCIQVWECDEHGALHTFVATITPLGVTR